MIFDLIISILAVAVAWFLGYSRGVKNTTELMIDEPERFQKILREVKRIKESQQLDDDFENNRETVIDIDREEGQYYAYASSGEFLAQGPDFRTMFERIKSRFPGRSFRINKYNAKLTDAETERMIKAVFESFGQEAPEDSTKNTWTDCVISCILDVQVDHGGQHNTEEKYYHETIQSRN